MIYILIAFLFSTPTWGAGQVDIIKSLTSCFSSNQLSDQVGQIVQNQEKYKGADLQLKLISGYTNNEVSNNNPERTQLGASIRWNDISDQTRRNSFVDSKIQMIKSESRLMLEEFWRRKLVEFYIWKWGRSAKNVIAQVRAMTTKQLGSGSSYFATVGSSKKYQELLALNQTSIEFLSKLEVIDQEVSKCAILKNWGENLDFSESEVKNYSTEISPRVKYQSSKCMAEKSLKTIQGIRDHGTWGVSFATSVNRNRRLGSKPEEFSDIRAGVELVIPLNTGNAVPVTVDRCDYERRNMYTEDVSERNEAIELYPLLRNIKRRNDLIKQKMSAVNLEKNDLSPEIVEMANSYLQSIQSLYQLEAKINSRIISSQIVENEFQK